MPPLAYLASATWKVYCCSRNDPATSISYTILLYSVFERSKFSEIWKNVCFRLPSFCPWYKLKVFFPQERFSIEWINFFSGHVLCYCWLLISVGPPQQFWSTQQLGIFLGTRSVEFRMINLSKDFNWHQSTFEWFSCQTSKHILIRKVFNWNQSTFNVFPVKTSKKSTVKKRSINFLFNLKEIYW